MAIVVSVQAGPEGMAALHSALYYGNKYNEKIDVVIYRPASQYSHTQIDEHVVAVADILDEAHCPSEITTCTQDNDYVAYLCDFVKTHEARVLFVGLEKADGSHGRTILGASVQRLILESSCPVVIVRPDHLQHFEKEDSHI